MKHTTCGYLHFIFTAYCNFHVANKQRVANFFTGEVTASLTTPKSKSKTPKLWQMDPFPLLKLVVSKYIAHMNCVTLLISASSCSRPFGSPPACPSGFSGLGPFFSVKMLFEFLSVLILGLTNTFSILCS